MKVTVKMPKVADSTDEVAVIEVATAVGEVIALGETILTVEADKADADVPSPVAGTVQEILVAINDEITTGAPVLIVESES